MRLEETFKRRCRERSQEADVPIPYAMMFPSPEETIFSLQGGDEKRLRDLIDPGAHLLNGKTPPAPLHVAARRGLDHHHENVG